MFNFVQYSLTVAFRYAKASSLSPISYTAILFSGILDWLFWHKIPDLFEYTGIGLIIFAGIIAIFSERNKEQKLINHLETLKR